jgi:hypothetical protein
MNETNFKRFVMIVKSAGFIDSKMMRSQNVLNFGYILYLNLREQNTNNALIEKYVRKWIVYSILTKRYSGSPESMFDLDIRKINELDFGEYLKEKELSELSEAFWTAGLVQNLNTSVTSSPYFNVFLASQIRSNDVGFLSSAITVSQLVSHRGDIHHIYPKSYLKKNGVLQNKYNQIANYVMTQQEINIKLGAKSPSTYCKQLIEQVNSGNLQYGAIEKEAQLMNNFKIHCVPEMIIDGEVENYDEFLIERRKLMAIKIKEYYYSL